MSSLEPPRPDVCDDIAKELDEDDDADNKPELVDVGMGLQETGW